MHYPNVPHEIVKIKDLDDEDKKMIISDINIKIGGDINELAVAYQVENDLVDRRDYLQKCLNAANSEVPSKLSTAIKKAEENSTRIDILKERREKLKVKVENFLNRTEPFRSEVNKRFGDIHKLEEVLIYLKSFEKIEDLSRQIQQCNDDEQAVLLYGELREMWFQYQNGHRSAYVKDYTRYWHNVLKDRLTKHYEEVLKLLKWPISSGAEHSPPPNEILVKFSNITKYLFLIQEPEDWVSGTYTVDLSIDPCLPVRLLLRPLKKRFTFHFTGTRQTARIDRPEWFLTQTLTWIKDHQGFVRSHVQPVADKLKLKSIKAVEEFNAGLIALAAERLHTVLAMYHSQSTKGEIVDVDAAFAHAVDETLGFHKELVQVTGKEADSVLSVLTKAETFLRWLAVEKKYALAKMDEILGSEQWSEPVGAGVGAASGALLWVPRGADWFISLLTTIEERYVILPQPGHRLRFLELQLELLEEWRVRLTQLMNAALGVMAADSFLTADCPRHLIAVINAAHHTRTVLLQWAHSLHYLQLHYYRRQFQHFTNRQHHDDMDSMTSSSDESESDSDKKSSKADGDSEEDAISLKDVELRAKKMALNEVTRRDSIVADLDVYDDIASPIANLTVTDPLPDNDDAEEAGVFAEAPALLAHLRDAGLAALADRILLEFKASLREYKKQKWHAMLIVEEMALSVSAALCRPLSALCGRMSRAAALLAPALAARLRAHLAAALDLYMFEEVVLENWFNTGGTMQFTHDVKRNLIPAFAPPNKSASQICQLPKLIDSCKLLNLDYDDARRLRALLAKQPEAGASHLHALGIRHLLPGAALQILNQRTDLSDSTTPSSVMELF